MGASLSTGRQAGAWTPFPEAHLFAQELFNRLRRQAKPLLQVGQVGEGLADPLLNQAVEARLREASEAGVLLALEGTVQGQPGWYISPSSASSSAYVVGFFEVSTAGDWLLRVGPVSEDDYYALLARVRGAPASASRCSSARSDSTAICSCACRSAT